MEKKKKGEERKIKIPPYFRIKIKFPKEIEAIREINKINKADKEYQEWIYKRRIIEEFIGKFTLIIGVRGKDGIVLGGDRKVIRGGETDFEDKVKHLGSPVPIIFAASGYVGIVDDFLEVFTEALNENIVEGNINNLLSIKFMAEDMVKDIVERYSARLMDAEPIRFIFGGLSELNKGEARLYEIGQPGFGQKIKYYGLIGHGRSYARTIAKYLFPKESGEEGVNLSVEEICPRVAACIDWIGGEVDDYVGGEPQVIYIIDNEKEVREYRITNDVREKVKELKDSVKSF